MIFFIELIEQDHIPSQFNNREYKPTSQRPLVYHLFGSIDYPQSMVLTEKDYEIFLSRPISTMNKNVIYYLHFLGNHYQSLHYYLLDII